MGQLHSMGIIRAVADACSALDEFGFVWIRSAFATPAAAFAESDKLLEEWASADGRDAVSVIGDFVLPPLGGPATRDFQTLHFDFGVPLHPLREQDVARYTALFIPRSAVGVKAVTRLVPLDALLGQRCWSDSGTLLENARAYGQSHGAWDDADGYSEGSLARVIEGVAGTPHLPSVKSTPGFLCGMEFDTLSAEMDFFRSLGLDVGAVQVEIPLRPGDLLIFDNLALAHGRRGSRSPGEMHQRVYGHRSLSGVAQRKLRDRFLALFERCQPAPSRAAASKP